MLYSQKIFRISKRIRAISTFPVIKSTVDKQSAEFQVFHRDNNCNAQPKL